MFVFHRRKSLNSALDNPYVVRSIKLEIDKLMLKEKCILDHTLVVVTSRTNLISHWLVVITIAVLAEYFIYTLQMIFLEYKTKEDFDGPAACISNISLHNKPQNTGCKTVDSVQHVYYCTCLEELLVHATIKEQDLEEIRGIMTVALFAGVLRDNE